jgi:transglutaminase-like putative cysteine protease
MFRAERAAPQTDAVRAAAVGWHREDERPRAIAAPAVVAAVAGFVAMWPYTSVIEPGAWSALVVGVIVVTAASGMAMRALLRRRPALLRDTATLAVQLLVVLAMITQSVSGDTAFFGIIPTPATLDVFRDRLAAAWQEVAQGSAPLAATPGLAAALGLGFAVVAILLDQLVAHRSAVLPALLTATVGAVPMIVTQGDTNVVWFVLLAATVLLLFRYSARRHPLSPARSSASLAAGVGIAAVVATLAVAPGLPLAAGITGTGTGITVDASLRLGDDLRQPNPVEVLTVATTAETAPYLRLTTLSDFDGRIWQPDRGDLQSQSEGFGEPEWGEEVAVSESATSIRILRMSSAWLPVPYPATGIQGVAASWRVMPENRTVVARGADAVGADYTVASLRVVPTLEQIRAVEAAPPRSDRDEDVEIPSIVGELAREVTAGQDTDYDRLLTLQDWFRAEFTYSLDTPVEEDFDGTGAEAVERFLEIRSGYCVHFAGAFTLMAESLGMQTRIVVGYLPGSRTSETRGEETVFSVSSDRLHSWPEVLFPGIGWVPFEPTASLGVPTEFRAATTGSGGVGDPAAPTQTTGPEGEQTTAPELERQDAGDNSTSSSELRRFDPVPMTLVIVGALIVLLLPAAVRRIVRARRMGRARKGDAGAAWAELRDTLVDLQLAVSDADTPRVRAAHLVRERSVDAQAIGRLTAAVERASYARDADTGEDLSGPLREVLAGLGRSVDAPQRLRALLLPRSLFAARGVDAASVA